MFGLVGESCSKSQLRSSQVQQSAPSEKLSCLSFYYWVRVPWAQAS